MAQQIHDFIEAKKSAHRGRIRAVGKGVASSWKKQEEGVRRSSVRPRLIQMTGVIEKRKEGSPGLKTDMEI